MQGTCFEMHNTRSPRRHTARKGKTNPSNRATNGRTDPLLNRVINRVIKHATDRRSPDHSVSHYDIAIRRTESQANRKAH